MSNNDDLINNILKELDNNSDGSEEPAADVTNSAPAEENDIPQDDGNIALPEPDDFPEEDVSEPEQPSPEAPAYTRAAMPQRRVQSRKHKKKKKRRSRVPGVLILTTFIVAVSIVLSLIIIAFGKDMLGIGKGDSTHLIVVKDGATTEDIAYLLKDEGIIRSPKAFIYFSKLRKSDAAYIPGEHFIKENMAYETIIQKLTTTESEAKEAVELTFKEGMRLDEIAQMLEENKVCKAKDFIFNFNSGGYDCDFEQKLKNTDNSLKFRRMEGYAFPDTYMFYEEMDPVEVCQKIYFNFNKKMTAERYQKMEKRGLTLDQLVTFASIVQREAASPETMNLVASVFWNRMKDPAEFAGKLQSDPTSDYAKFIKQNLEVKNTTMIDAYDTYKGEGLPPGAICNPGLDAIDAVLDAIETDYKYFVANIYTGETYFSKTLDEHNAYVAQVKQEEAEYLATMETTEEANEAAPEDAQEDNNAQQ